jgi:glutamine amidotransferase
MIGIIDYGMGNLGSVRNACSFLDLDAHVITDPAEMDRCVAVILPGVGGFADCMRHLEGEGFADPIRAWIGAEKPFLGICLGLQILFETSEEAPDVPGLAVLKGKVRRFEEGPGRKVPQIGWNRVSQVAPTCPLFESIPDNTHFYFVHSYYAEPAEQDVVAGATCYGANYASVVWRNRMMAVQFHPEKSQQLGLRLLRNFNSRIVRSANSGSV